MQDDFEDYDDDFDEDFSDHEKPTATTKSSSSKNDENPETFSSSGKPLKVPPRDNTGIPQDPGPSEKSRSRESKPGSATSAARFNFQEATVTDAANYGD